MFPLQLQITFSDRPTFQRRLDPVHSLFFRLVMIFRTLTIRDLALGIKKDTIEINHLVKNLPDPKFDQQC